MKNVPSRFQKLFKIINKLIGTLFHYLIGNK